jgi:Na+/melibiose symporter-like transporter
VVNYAYLVGWLFIYYIGTSFITLSHLSWASVIAPTYHERSRVFGAIQVIGILGATAVLILPVVMARRDGSSGAGDVSAMGWFVIVAVAIGVVLALMFARERIVADAKDERFGLRDYWEMVSRPDMARIIIADFCLALGPGWMSALYLFYFHDARGFTIANASKLLLVYIVAGVVGAAAMSWVARRIGKHRTQMCASTGYSLGLVALIFLPRADFMLAAVFMAMMGFLASAFILLDRAMVADVGDAVRLEQGKHRIGLLYAMITTTQKVAGALSITLSFTVLGLIGYNAKEGAINTPAAIHGMELVYLIGPVVFVMLGGACFIGYKLDSKRHAQIREQLEHRDALIPEAPVLETLSGGQTVPSRMVEPI